MDVCRSKRLKVTDRQESLRAQSTGKPTGVPIVSGYTRREPASGIVVADILARLLPLPSSLPAGES